MRKNQGSILSKGLLVVIVWLVSGVTAFAAEGSLMKEALNVNQASVLTQTGSLGVIGYIVVGVAMAGFGFMVRKKI